MAKDVQRKVPEVRFKGFTDDWEQRKLGKIAQRIRGNDGRMDLPLLTISARQGWLTQQKRFSNNIAGKEKKNYTLLRKNQLSYNHGNSKAAIYGTVYSLKDYQEALVPKIYHSFSLIDNNSSKFIESYFHTKKLDRQLRKYISSTARMDGLLNISFSDFMKILLFLPSYNEQIRISKLMISVSKLVTLQQRKLEQLKLLKRALLQNLFTNNRYPKIRFKGSEGPWEQRKVSNVAERLDNLRIPIAASRRKKGTTPYYGANGVQDYVAGFTHDGENVLIAEDGANDIDNYPVRFVKGKIWVNNHAHVLKTYENIMDNRFLVFALKK